jgi:hypothetical protein
MTNFIRYKDEIINLDLVASINKSQYRNSDPITDVYTVIFYGAYVYREIACLQFDDEEIRDKTFDDICYTIASNLNCSLDSITEITKNNNLTYNYSKTICKNH